jgi:glycosyltransferase involved in cell wall biosynthesis
MSSIIGNLCRKATRKDDEPLNVLTFPTHERYETNLARTGHNFYSFRAPGIKDWNLQYALLPKNYTLLNPELGEKQIPSDLEFDLILSQNKFGQIQLARQLAVHLHLPLISLEHTLPMEEWNTIQLLQLQAMRGDVNIFISEYSRQKWGWSKETADVIHHGIDTDTFSPGLYTEREPYILSVVNDWVNRDWCCGYNLWRKVTNGLQVKAVGDTPGLSKPAASISDLVKEYRQAPVFLNTSLISPVPTALLEAMACGCAVVSTATCMIPEIIKNGFNGFISNEPEELTEYCLKILEDEDLGLHLGKMARETICSKFSLDKFITNWNTKFTEASKIFFTGE